MLPVFVFLISCRIPLSLVSESDFHDQSLTLKYIEIGLLAHTDTNRKFVAENHSKVKQFDKEDILNRFKRADSTTTYVAVLFVFFFICQHNLEEFFSVDKHLRRFMKYCMFRLYGIFFSSTSKRQSFFCRRIQ